MTNRTETGAALAIVWPRLCFAIRAYACEVLTSWALKVAPKGYVPSFVEACADAYQHRGLFRSVPVRQQTARRGEMANEFSGGDVNAVLRLVRDLAPPDNGDVQLSILTYALVTACKSCGIERDTVLEAVEAAYVDERLIVPLDSPAARASS